MARGKKNETELTIEERLEQALVPVEEQPYEVPENWCWVKLPETFTNCTDSKKKIQKNTYLDDGLWAVVDQGQELIGGYTNDETMTYHGELPVVIFGDHTRCIKYVDFRFAQGADGIKVLKPKAFYLPKAFYYALQELSIPNMGYRRHFPLFSQYSLPLPPLAEQQRIVDRIESMFAKLDEAREKAQAVVDGFETRKVAILHKAFTRELTNYWCIEHGVDRKRWITKNLGDITINHDSQRIPLSREERNDLAPLFDYYGASGVIDRVDRFIFEGRFLLIGEDGANLVMRSKPIAFIAEGQFWVNNHAHVLDTADAISMDFLCYYINSIDLTSYITGSAQPKMSQAKMNSIPVPVPAIDEQIEIVHILDSLLTKEQQAKEAAEAVLDQIETMKKSILARAFRGDLGTNNPAEKSAVELLKNVFR